jgi:hypothetical protein
MKKELSDWEKSTKLLYGQYVLDTTNASGLCGFNIRVMGGTLNDLYKHSDWRSMYGGFLTAEELIKEGRIYYINNFKCECGDYRFQYGGTWVCNTCENKGAAPWWTIKVVQDGDQYCCVGEDFINLQESTNYAFGKTKEEAKNNYEKLFQKGSR